MRIGMQILERIRSTIQSLTGRTDIHEGLFIVDPIGRIITRQPINGRDFMFDSDGNLITPIPE
jgi:hypothetical protein